MKIRLLDNNRKSGENLRVIQGIRYLNKEIDLKEARDIAIDGGEFEITNKDEEVIGAVLDVFDLLEVKAMYYRESDDTWIETFGGE